MSMSELRQLVTHLQIVTRDQWKSASSDIPSSSKFFDRLQEMPAWWNPLQPALSVYQRKVIEDGLKKGFRYLDRELRVNDFLMLERLGEGGMAVVYKAWSIEWQKIVAIKQLICNDHRLRDRQRREARIMQKLNHPRIARFLGFDPIDNGEGFLLVMEFIEGKNLKDYVAAHGPVTVDQTVAWLIELLDALMHAHQMEVIHRDITAKNIMVESCADGRSPSVSLLDFGLGKLMPLDEDKTGAGVVLGTPQFMSPEHFRDSHHITPESDLYSLACNAYVMLTGAPPFKGKQLPELCMKHLEQSPPPLCEFRSDIPAHVEQTIQRMLSKHPKDRGTIPQLIACLRGESQRAPQMLVEIGTAAIRQKLSAPEFVLSPAAPLDVTPDSPELLASRLNTPTVDSDRSVGLVPVNVMEHPESSMFAHFVPVSSLTLAARFIDPVPTAADALYTSWLVAKATFLFSLLLTFSLFVFTSIWGR